MVERAVFHNEALLEHIARTRWRIPTHAGRVGKMLHAAPYVSNSSLGLIRASTRLSQGRWLANLAVTAGKRAGGRPIQTVELGTCVGISGMYLLAGMSQGGGGHLTTFEGHEDYAELARFHMNTFIREHALTNVTFEVVVGWFRDTVGKFFAEPAPALDLVFIDGHHHEGPTVEYHAAAKRRMTPTGIIVHDDISWSEGMIRAWSTITNGEDCQIEELMLGGRASRGVIYLGTTPGASPLRHHLDGPVERAARFVYDKARALRS